MSRKNPNAQKPSIFLLENSILCQGDYSHDLVTKHDDDIWRLQVAESLYFDFSPTMRDEILEDCASLFVHWVLDGYKREITHHYDPPWDASGLVTQKKVGEGALLFWYQTLGEWMEAELTGKQIPTYMSGYGLYSEIFEDEIREYIENDALPNTFYASLPVEKRQVIEDTNDENDVWFDGCQIFTNALMVVLKQIPTNIAWENLKESVINSRQLAAEKLKRVQKFRSTCKQLSQDLLEQCLPLLSQRRIERPIWKEEGLKDYLLEILKQKEIQYVVAVAEVGLSR
jgi:hypothetical protein